MVSVYYEIHCLGSISLTDRTILVPKNEGYGANFNAAVSKLEGGTNNYYSKMYWDVRTGPYDHPANK